MSSVRGDRIEDEVQKLPACFAISSALREIDDLIGAQPKRVFSFLCRAGMS